jgi:hypothetical protein
MVIPLGFEGDYNILSGFADLSPFYISTLDIDS